VVEASVGLTTTLWNVGNERLGKVVHDPVKAITLQRRRVVAVSLGFPIVYLHWAERIQVKGYHGSTY
jgi:hypothetical protein